MISPFHAIDERFGLEPLPAARQPVFLLAAGWRSGSTLLQRLVVSSGEVLVWGEPYGRAGIVPALTRATLAFQPDWPSAAAIAPEEIAPGSDLKDQWIANLYSHPRDLRSALRALLDGLLAEPAHRRGFARFGLKEVRLSAIDALWLKWLYPDARFVFLVRNPWDAWASMSGATWYWRWPDQAIRTATEFAQVWNGLATTFLQWRDESGLLMRYEDLKRVDSDLDPLRRHLELREMDAGVLKTTIRGLVRPPATLTPDEIAAIAAPCGALAGMLGYAPPDPPACRAG